MNEKIMAKIKMVKIIRTQLTMAKLKMVELITSK
jgi:hypothetical protein